MSQNKQLIAISMKTHRVCMDGQNVITTGDGNVLLENIKDESLVSVDSQIVSDVFGISFEERYEDNETLTVDTTEEEDEISLTASQSQDFSRATWSRSEILKLIHAYKKNVSLFNSSTVRKEKIWKSIAADIINHSPEQCQNKFKYLKSKYFKKKDNMSSKASGAKIINFEYFEEFQSIFGKYPNVNPLFVASSSSQKGESNKTLDNTENSTKIAEENTDENPDKVHKKTEILVKKSGKGNKKDMKQVLMEYNEKFEKKEAAKQKRHDENIQIKNEALNTFKACMDRLFEKENTD